LFDTDTIVALATANAMGSISIVRISGPNALDIASKISHKDSFQPRYATLCNLYNQNNEIIDEALVLYFKNPFSFTGEDVVEFQCHGGMAVSSMIVNEVIAAGARLATPGEFSKRAFLNGKIDLSKAEAIAKMIEAQSEDAVKLLAKQLKGELREFVENIRKDLLFMLAYTEVSIDYAEEDLPDDILEQINEKLLHLEQTLKSTLQASEQREGLIEGFKVAIVGKPNVGKSSLLNKLLNFQRAIISDIAGTTRDTIEERIKIGTHLIKIVDTAGIRNSSDVIEKIGIEKSMQVIEEADFVVALFDASKPLDSEDETIISLLEKLPQNQKIMVLNKVDLPCLFETKILGEHIQLSTKQSIEVLIQKLEQRLNQSVPSDGMTLISKRQISAVQESLEHIIQSQIPLQSGELEFFAHHVTQALQSIGSITKAYENDEMLDAMFGQFCLGK
jgi:tRNA modification GTPase